MSKTTVIAIFMVVLVLGLIHTFIIHDFSLLCEVFFYESSHLFDSFLYSSHFIF